MSRGRSGGTRPRPNRVFDAALRALTPPVENSIDDPRHPEENDGNAGFLRPDARLWVIAITDRDDESPELPGFYFNSLVELKGFRNKHLFGFFAVAGAPETGCAGADGRIAAPANRLGAIVDMTDTGRLLSICADWHAEDLGEFFYYGWPQSFVLTGHPTDLNGNGAITDTDGEIEVALNGRVVSSRSADGRTIWFYEEWGERESIYFSPMAVPKPGTTIDVRYLPECP